MSTDRDTARIVRSWLEEGRTTLPDWVRDDVMDRLPSTPQRRSRWTAWRFTTMPTAAKTAIAAAAVILVAVGAFAFLQRPTGPSATPTPTPSPTTTPTPTESAEPSAPVMFVPRSGSIPAGTYLMGEEATIALEIPPFWTAWAGDNYPTGTDIRKNRNGLGELQIWVDASDEISVYPDVCVSDTVPLSVGPTVDDLVTALRAQEGSETSEPADVTIGGQVVQQYEISYAQGIDVASCTGGVARVWFSGASGYIASSEPNTATVYMVQTDAGRIVFGFDHTDDASAADVAELDAIVESMVIAP